MKHWTKKFVWTIVSAAAPLLPTADVTASAIARAPDHDVWNANNVDGSEVGPPAFAAHRIFGGREQWEDVR